jgi:hypothetical protein
MGLFRDAFDAADSKQFDITSQLPPLRESNSRPDSSVRTRAKSYCDAVDLFPLKPCISQSLLNHSDGFGGASASLNDFDDRWGGMRRLSAEGRLHDGDASLRRGKLKRQYLHK